MKFDKFWTNLELRLTNLGRYLPVFRSVFPVFAKTEFLAAYRYFFPNEEKILAYMLYTLLVVICYYVIWCVLYEDW
jgi:type II secretory pathway component PulM